MKEQKLGKKCVLPVEVAGEAALLPYGNRMGEKACCPNCGDGIAGMKVPEKEAGSFRVIPYRKRNILECKWIHLLFASVNVCVRVLSGKMRECYARIRGAFGVILKASTGIYALPGVGIHCMEADRFPEIFSVMREDNERLDDVENLGDAEYRAIRLLKDSYESLLALAMARKRRKFSGSKPMRVAAEVKELIKVMSADICQHGTDNISTND